MPERAAAGILVVDDNDAPRYLPARVLPQAGYQILERATAAKLWTRAAEQLFGCSVGEGIN